MEVGTQRALGVILEAPLQLRVKLCLGDELTEGIIDVLYSCVVMVNDL